MRVSSVWPGAGQIESIVFLPIFLATMAYKCLISSRVGLHNSPWYKVVPFRSQKHHS